LLLSTHEGRLFEHTPAGVHKSLGVGYNLRWTVREASELEVLRIAKIFGIRWAVSSEAERLLHEQEVAGSSPAPPTNFYCDFWAFSPSF
jgi:hypothetical protein